MEIKIVLILLPIIVALVNIQFLLFKSRLSYLENAVAKLKIDIMYMESELKFYKKNNKTNLKVVKPTNNDGWEI
jgi:hypothetical protein